MKLLSRLFIALAMLLQATSFAGWTVQQQISFQDQTQKKHRTLFSKLRIENKKARIDISLKGKKNTPMSFVISKVGRSVVCFQEPGPMKGKCLEFNGGMNMGFLSGLQSMGMKIQFETLSVRNLKKKKKIKGYACQQHEIKGSLRGEMPGVPSISIQLKNKGCYTRQVAYKDITTLGNGLGSSVKQLFPTRNTLGSYLKWLALGLPLEETRTVRTLSNSFGTTTREEMKTLAIRREQHKDKLFIAPPATTLSQLTKEKTRQPTTSIEPVPDIPQAPKVRRKKSLNNTKDLFR